MKSRRSIFLLAAVAALVLAAAGTASAAPVWKFNGTELTGKETLVGAAISSSLTVPGATTECTHFLYNMKVSNAGGKGTGEITELPLFECSTNNAACKVGAIEAEKLPWPTHLETIGTSDYLFVEGVNVIIEYTGSLCAVAGEELVHGTAGGIVENTAQTVTFNKTTFTATGAVLKVGATAVEWNGVFTTEPFETRREQKVEA